VGAMAKLTTVFGAVFVLMAGGFYFGTGRESFTALIPGVWGVVYLACGLVSRTPRATKIAMHIAVVFAVLGVLTIGRPIMNWTSIEDPALIAQLLLAVINAVLLAMYLRAFLAARRVSG